MSMRVFGLIIGAGLVMVCMAASIAFGKHPLPLHAAADALFSFDGSREHLIVRTVRLPRALTAMAVGACLAMAGTLMQAVTRNALAGPELFGVNQGAALMIVLSIYGWGRASFDGYVAFAFAGAAAAGVIVYALASIGSAGRSLPAIRLVLAGSTVNLLFASLTQGVLVFDEESLDTMRFWLAGSLTGRSSGLLVQVAPFMAVGAALALLLGRQMNLLSLGEETAEGLGQRTAWVKAAALAAVTLLAGASVALAGPIGFIGLAVPHLTRFLIGSDNRWVLPYSALNGAILLLLADLAARFIVPSQEISAGIVTAALGAPFLLYLAQRREAR